ncbi:MAG: hypothetical protein MJ229_01015 [bacterium]|nr:hypothetical protein [bacterium]
MLQAFIVIFFILEFVLALIIIYQIIKLDMKVNAVNKSLPLFKYSVVANLSRLKDVLFSARTMTKKVVGFIENQRRRYVYEMMKEICTISIFLLCRGKFRKYYMAYCFGKEIVNGINEV